MNTKSIIQSFDRFYYLLMVAIAPAIIWLNFHGQGMQGIIGNYLDFKRIILSGFNPAAGIYALPTFPMWGYGWLFLVTENKTMILVFQNALAIFAPGLTLPKVNSLL